MLLFLAVFLAGIVLVFGVCRSPASRVRVPCRRCDVAFARRCAASGAASLGKGREIGVMCNCCGSRCGVVV